MWYNLFMDKITTKFNNYSQASRLRQSRIPKEVRVARARAAANAKWSGVSQEERRAHAVKMVMAKHNPQKKEA